MNDRDREENKNLSPQENDEQALEEITSLDDDRRVKVLSPAMLVFRRFIRNKLAITGTVFIVFMFLFSFIGGLLNPYGETEQFKRLEEQKKEFGGITQNTDFRFTLSEGMETDNEVLARFIEARNTQKNSFETGKGQYAMEEKGKEFYQLTRLTTIATATAIGGQYTVTPAPGQAPGEGFEQAFLAAAKDEGAETFSFGGVTYTLLRERRSITASLQESYAFASKLIFDFRSKEDIMGYSFRLAAEEAFRSLQPGASAAFTADGKNYTVSLEGEEGTITAEENGANVAVAAISNYIVQTQHEDIFLSLEYKALAKKALLNNQETFTFPGASGEDELFTLQRKDLQWEVRRTQFTTVLDSYAAPNAEHLLGTDGNGMDILTRLMYGGRVSLLIGFIVVFLETFIGVVLGGIAGYFGKWVDNLIMRIVDIFNCIPSLPLIIILGAIMDANRVSSDQRMVYLMIILGVLGWPSIARMVRGQILSLREQEFMTATEATGLSVPRRIFKHLVPNVIPQLIVICTMSLGDIILLESTLSFLGLGVKHPYASWGNIINAVQNSFVLENHLFVWIPAGFCILITVLGFNFIGDGLRDAFDPKMKR